MPRPLLGFVQIGLFASPELPISGRRHQRVEGRADVGREAPRGAGIGEGGGSLGAAQADRSQICPPHPSCLLPPPSLPFTSELVRWEPPCSGGVPAYISHLRAESLNQIYGFWASVRETATAAVRPITCAPKVDRDPAGDRPPELDAVAELHQTGEGFKTALWTEKKS